MESAFVKFSSQGISLDMIYVEGGEFNMGSEASDAYDWEKPIHKVQVDGFYIGKFSVTQAVWKAVMGADNNPSFFQGDDRPVEQVSWEDCQEFIKKLNTLTDKTYRLPTEAEWEHAARGGGKSKDYLYSGSNKLEEVGWYGENSDGETKAVGQKEPNELGIYDMSGNVDEWCQDWYDGNYYEASAKQGLVRNPKGPKGGDYRVFRGGSWLSRSGRCRSTSRSNDSPGERSSYLGFRLVLSPSLG